MTLTFDAESSII